MKKHAGKLILSGLIISGLGLLWLLFATIVIFIESFEYTDLTSIDWTDDSLLAGIVTLVFIVFIIPTTIISLTRYRKEKAPNFLAILPMIVSAMGLGYVLSFVANEITSIAYYLQYGYIGDWFRSLFVVSIISGILPQIIGYILLFIGFMGWFAKAKEDTLPYSSASFSLAGSILYFGATILSCVNLARAFSGSLYNAIMNFTFELLISFAVVFFAINIFVKCKKGKIPMISLTVILGLSSAGFFSLFIDIFDSFKYGSMSFIERIEPLLSTGILMKMIVYVIFIIGTIGILVKKNKIKE